MPLSVIPALMCDVLPNVEHSMTSTESVMYGAEVNVTCSEGFEFKERPYTRSLTCQLNGAWSDDMGNWTCSRKSYTRCDQNVSRLVP